MTRLVQFLQLFYYLNKLSKNPEDTAAALKISSLLSLLGLVDIALKTIQPYEAQLNSSNYFLKPIDLNYLKNLPPGTLGAVYAQHMLSNNLDPNFYGPMESLGAGTKFLSRIRQTHDLWHVLSGFSTSVQDELGLQAFIHSQVRSPLPLVLIGAAFLKAGLTKNPFTHVVFDRIVLGWKTGWEAKNIYALDWDANWTTPIDELRARYDLKAVTPSLTNYRAVSETASSSTMNSHTFQ